MAYTSPRTWTTGATGTLLNASALNTDIRDNMASLRGLNDAACRLYLTADTGISNAADTAVTWQASAYNVGGMWSSGTNPTRVTVPTTGYYELNALLAYHFNSGGGSRRVSYRVNGGTVTRLAVRQATDEGQTYAFGSDVINLTAGDYLEILAFQDSTATVKIDSGPAGSTLTVRLLGDANAATWTAPTTYQLSAGLTAAGLNTDLRDNVLTLRGMQGYALKLSMTANLSVANGNGVRPTWNNAIFSIGSGMWSSAVSASEVTVPITGYWETWGRATWALNSSGRRGVRVALQGSATGDTLEQDMVGPVTATGNTVGFSDLLYLSSGTKLMLDVIQECGAALNLIGGTTGSVFGVRLVGTTG